MTTTRTFPGRPAPALEPPAWPGRKPAVPASLAVPRSIRNTEQDTGVQVA